MVIVQSQRLDAYRRRVVIPLVVASAVPTGTLVGDGDRIIAAIDIVISRAWK